jgi:hypothetical protein
VLKVAINSINPNPKMMLGKVEIKVKFVFLRVSCDVYNA